MRPVRKMTVRGVLRAAAAAAGILLLGAVFYVVAVTARPETDEEQAATPGPLPAAEESFAMASRADLTQLLDRFGLPVLASQKLSLLGGQVEDIPWNGGWARRASLLYELGDDTAVTAVSVRPLAAGETLLRENWHPDAAVHRLAGMYAALLESPDGPWLLAQTGTAVYALYGRTSVQILGAAENMVLMVAR